MISNRGRLRKELEKTRNLLAKEILMNSVLSDENARLRAKNQSLLRKAGILRNSQAIIEGNYQSLRAESYRLKETLSSKTLVPEDYILSRKFSLRGKKLH